MVSIYKISNCALNRNTLLHRVFESLYEVWSLATYWLVCPWLQLNTCTHTHTGTYTSAYYMHTIWVDTWSHKIFYKYLIRSWKSGGTFMPANGACHALVIVVVPIYFRLCRICCGFSHVSMCVCVCVLLVFVVVASAWDFHSLKAHTAICKATRHTNYTYTHTHSYTHIL